LPTVALMFIRMTTTRITIITVVPANLAANTMGITI
jgi:hypothetical protein